MRRRFAPSALSVACAMFSAACVHHPFERDLRAGRWHDAEAAFRADSALQRDAGALASVARLHAAPDSAMWDPDSALALLARARAYAPGGRLPEGDAVLESVLKYVVRGRAAVEARERAVHDLLEALRADTARLHGELARVREDMGVIDAERALLERMVARLESDLRDRESQIAAIRSELDRLKEIDLTRASRHRP